MTVFKGRRPHRTGVKYTVIPDSLRVEIERALRGLLKVAEIAMPDTYFASGARVRRAQRVLEELKKARAP